MSSPLYPRKPIWSLDFSQGEYGVRRKGGIPNNVEFDGEKAVFDGKSTTYLKFPTSPFAGVVKQGKAFSIRLKFSTTETVDTRRLFVIEFSSSRHFQTMLSSGKLNFSFWDGGDVFRKRTTTIINDGVEREFVIVYDGSSASLYVNSVGASEAGVTSGSYVDGTWLSSFDNYNAKSEYRLVEVYNTALIPEEVSLLYQSKLYQKPTFNTLLDITTARGVIEDKAGNGFTNNGVEVVRDGSQWVMKYSSAHITASPSGSYKAVAFWLKPDSNTEQIIRIGSNDITVSSGTLTASWADDIFVNGVAGTSITERKWQRIVVRVDTALTISSIDIGHTGSYYNGLLANVKVVESMTDEQIMNDFNAERKAFNV